MVGRWLIVLGLLCVNGELSEIRGFGVFSACLDGAARSLRLDGVAVPDGLVERAAEVIAEGLAVDVYGDFIIPEDGGDIER